MPCWLCRCYNLQPGYQNWSFKNNWHSTIAELKGQLAVMRGNSSLWTEAIQQIKQVMDFCE